MLFRAYPTLRYLIFLIAGILCADKLNRPLGVIAAIFVVVTGFGFISVSFRKFYSLRYLIPFSFFFLGILTSSVYNQKISPDHISHYKDIKGSMVEIIAYTETKAKTFKTIGQIKAVYDGRKWQQASGKVILYFNQQANVFPKYGDIYVLNENLRQIEAPKNPYEFDYKAYQSRINIFHHQFLRAGDFRKIGESTKRGIFYYANKANEYTHEVFRQVVDNQNQLGVAEAMIGGMRSELDEDTLAWYTKTGTVHALAVSGMHIAILFWVLNKFFGLFLNRRKLPFIIIILTLLWAYAVFTGLSASVCRSTLMFSIFQIGIFIRRDGNSVNTLLFSALVLLMLVPAWIYDVGFQLSYLAVLGILVFYPWLNRRLQFKNRILKWTWDITAVSIAAQIYTLPLTLYYFHQFPNYSLLANPIVSLVCIPLLPLGLLVLFFYKIPFIGVFLGWIFKWLIIIMNYCVHWVYKLPFSVTEGLALSAWGVALMFLMIGVFQYYLKSGRAIYLKAVAVVIAVFFTIGVFKKFKQGKQEEITFHYIPNAYGVSLIDGRSALFLSKDSLIKELKIDQYHLKNYYDSKGINIVEKRAVDEEANQILKSKFGNVFWIKKKIMLTAPKTEITLVSNNALHLSSVIKGTLLILDGSNKKWYVEQMKERYPETVVLYDTGSQTYKIK